MSNGGLDFYQCEDNRSPSSEVCMNSSPCVGHVMPTIDMNMDTIPFSESFSGIIQHMAGDDEKVEIPADAISQSEMNPDQIGMTASESFDIARITNIKDVDPNWADDEIEEILVISPRHKSCSRMHLPTLPSNKKHYVTNFDFLHVLGTGRFAKVYLARREADSKLYAVKSVRKRAVLDEYCTPHVRSEQACLKMVTELLAPFLPRLHWSFQDEERLYMAMDFYPGGDLLTHLTRDGYFNTERCVFYASEIAEAVSYLHSLGIVHRDLKPDNIMIADDGHIVLTDFGLAKMLFFSDEEIPKTGSCCGTREYQAPEMLLGWSYDFSVDCWGFGLLLYTMHYGRHPFMSGDQNEHPGVLQNKIIHGSTLFYPIPEIPASTRQLISMCLERNPRLRLNISGIQSHEYFKSIDWSRVRTKGYDAPFVPISSNDKIDLLYFDDQFLDISANSPLLHLDNHPTPIVDENAFDGYSFTWDAPPNTTPDIPDTRKKSVTDFQSVKPISSRPSSPVIHHIRSILKHPSQHFGSESRLSGPHSKSRTAADLDRPKSFPVLPSTPTPRKLRKRRASSATQHVLSTRKPFSPLSMNSGSKDTKDLSLLRKMIEKTTSPRPSPLPGLPKDVVQSGQGIGFTHTTPASRSRLSLSSLASKSCFGGLGLGMRKRESRSECLPTSQSGNRYGSSWSLGLNDEARISSATIEMPDGLGQRHESIEPTENKTIDV